MDVATDGVSAAGAIRSLLLNETEYRALRVLFDSAGRICADLVDRRIRKAGVAGIVRWLVSEFGWVDRRDIAAIETFEKLGFGISYNTYRLRILRLEKPAG